MPDKPIESLTPDMLPTPIDLANAVVGQMTVQHAGLPAGQQVAKAISFAVQMVMYMVQTTSASEEQRKAMVQTITESMSKLGCVKEWE